MSTPLVTRHFTDNGPSPVKWVKREAKLTSGSGETILQTMIEVPESWSINATNIVADKYLRHVATGNLAESYRESSVKQMIERVVGTIGRWGSDFEYFADLPERKAFEDELTYILVNQLAAFNSPVWFNLGTTGGKHNTEQVSACFINSVEDDLRSILDLSLVEGWIYKNGSGSGVNYSKLRSSREKLTSGGYASGPVPFIAKDDANAGSIKSGGTTRRAAKMAILNADHGDIFEFVTAKLLAEKAARALVSAGFDGDFRNNRTGAYAMVPFQNANHSVRVTNVFMHRLENGDLWHLRARDSTTLETTTAKALWTTICDAAHACGDPGLQFDDVINEWHTTPNSGRINASNPCCLPGETLVDTSEGRVRIDELERMSRSGEALPHAFSYDRESRLPVLRKITKTWVAGKTTKLVEVTTERGLVFRCTPEHEWLTYAGQYVAAEKLEPGTRLRKINRTINDQRSARRSVLFRPTSEHPNGTEYQSRFMWEQAYGPIPSGMDVHHKNEDPTDDRLSNLELLPRLEHLVEHATGSANPRFMQVAPRKLVEVWEALENEIPSKSSIDAKNVTPGRWNSYVRNNGLVGVIPQAQSPTTGGKIQGMFWNAFTLWMGEQRDALNDRVASVRMVTLNAPIEVYDLEVEGTHNFAVANNGFEHTIVISNSEYMHLDDSACNLASINLKKFFAGSAKSGEVDFIHTTRILILAMDILVSGAAYPTPKIAANARKFRQLGLGYTNLGATLMSRGLAYDSDEGRGLAAAITALMTGTAYSMSADIAARNGAFEGFKNNRSEMLGVIQKHRVACQDLRTTDKTNTLLLLAEKSWRNAYERGLEHGFRNAQATVLAPTGTISFIMDCDTTGIEPDLALQKVKKLVGGATMRIVNASVLEALKALHYEGDELEEITDYISMNNSIVDAPHVTEVHYPVFDTALAEPIDQRSIRPEAHVLMMGAVQPFISGAISKTVNMPAESTIDDVSKIYKLAYAQGVKAIAIYRDNSKGSQPLASSSPKADESNEGFVRSPFFDDSDDEDGCPNDDLPADLETSDVKLSQPQRRRLRDERESRTFKLEMADHEGYLHVGLYEDGTPGEIFIRMSKEGSTVSGLLDAFAIQTSLLLQHGIPLVKIIEKFEHTRFEPSGWTKLGYASSILDYIARLLRSKFIDVAPVDVVSTPTASMRAPTAKAKTTATATATATATVATGKTCPKCGNVSMVRTGTCETCATCGFNEGCG